MLHDQLWVSVWLFKHQKLNTPDVLEGFKLISICLCLGLIQYGNSLEPLFMMGRSYVETHHFHHLMVPSCQHEVNKKPIPCTPSRKGPALHDPQKRVKSSLFAEFEWYCSMEQAWNKHFRNCFILFVQLCCFFFQEKRLCCTSCFTVFHVGQSHLLGVLRPPAAATCATAALPATSLEVPWKSSGETSDAVDLDKSPIIRYHSGMFECWIIGRNFETTWKHGSENCDDSSSKCWFQLRKCMAPNLVRQNTIARVAKLANAAPPVMPGVWRRWLFYYLHLS